MKLIQWEVEWWKSALSSEEEFGFLLKWVQRVLHTDKLVHSDIVGMSLVCNFAHKGFRILKTGKWKWKTGFLFWPNRNLVESSKSYNFSLGSFLKLKSFVLRLDEQFQPEAVQSNQFENKKSSYKKNSLHSGLSNFSPKNKKSTVKIESFCQKLSLLTGNLWKEILTVAVLKETYLET